jgi:type IV pilus assembly protein PilQ
MMMEKKMINMKSIRYQIFVPILFTFLFINIANSRGQGRDFPVREYTNPEELVTFDRTTTFARALDVINQFSQKYHNKIIIDRTGTKGSIGIGIPPMHWMDALELILRVKQLQLLELAEFYEIVLPQLPAQQNGTAAAGSSGAATAEGEVIPTLDTRAVRINAIFFEGNRRALQEIGVDWSTLTENVPEAILGGGGEGGGIQLPSAEFGGPFVQVNSEGASNVSQSVFDALVNFGEIGTSGIEVQALFSAFEADNLGEIIASPTIKVLDGVEGRIQVGQDFSIKQRDFAGNVVETFFSVGTILTVTPQIYEQNGQTFIHLTVNAERSTAQPDPVSTIINKTQAETEALLLDEEATVIAGLYRTEQIEVRRGVPILKDLPAWFFGLKYLFGYTSHDQIMRELVIIIQADIVPSLTVRADQEELPGEYEVLENERALYRHKIKRSGDVFTGESFADELEDIAPKDDFQAEQEDSSVEKDTPVEEDTTEVTEAAKIEEKNMEENVPPVITNPEIDNPVIELDFGNDGLEPNTDSVEEDQQTKEIEEDEPVVQEEESSPRFYIIGGSFRVNQNAIDLRNSFREKGFDGAVIIEKEGAPLQMVAYGSYSSFEKARDALAKIQKTQNPNAWLYRGR